MRRLRICMVGYYLPPMHTGAGLQALTLAGALRSDCEIMFLTARHDPSSPLREERSGCTIYRLAGVGRGQLFAATFALRAAWRLWRWRDRYDVVHTHGFPPFYFWMTQALAWAKKPNLYTMSMFGGDDPVTLCGGRLGGVRRRALRQITAKVATTNQMMAACATLPAAVRERCLQIPYAVDTRRFRPATAAERAAWRAEFGWEAGAPVGVFVGAVIERKGVRELVAAWAEVVQAIPRAQLLLVGPVESRRHGGPATTDYAARVRQLIEERGLGANVRLVGNRDDVEVFMRNADVFCLASKQEGLPIVYLEALASGTPIVTFEVAGAADAVANGVTGFRVPQGASAEYAGAVVRILSDAVFRAQLQAVARRDAEERFALDRIAGRYLALYRELAGA